MNAYAALRRIALEVTPPIISRAISDHIVARIPLLRQQSSTTKSICTLRELDEEIAKADAASRVSDDELRQVLGSFQFVVKHPLPKDPFSSEYRDAQMRLYAYISGRDHYSPYEDEQTLFDLDAAKSSPFPYSTQSGNTVGEQLMMQGFMIRSMNLRPGSRILEFGPGWGNTTLHLAQMGYRVCAVDVYQSFLELIAFRANQLGVEVDLVKADMLEFTSDQRFDAVVFFECFHHCSDHLRMMERLHDLVSDYGVVVFAGEPISNLPYPWGLRPDGMAMWSVRKFGWLELGFTPSYFMEALSKYGWWGGMRRSLDCPDYSIVIAWKQRS